MEGCGFQMKLRVTHGSQNHFVSLSSVERCKSQGFWPCVCLHHLFPSCFLQTRLQDMLLKGKAVEVQIDSDSEPTEPAQRLLQAERWRGWPQPRQAYPAQHRRPQLGLVELSQRELNTGLKKQQQYMGTASKMVEWYKWQCRQLHRTDLSRDSDNQDSTGFAYHAFSLLLLGGMH